MMVVFGLLLQSNVRREKIQKPDPPCVICNGSGRVDCRHCCGRGISFSSLSLSLTHKHKLLTRTCYTNNFLIEFICNMSLCSPKLGRTNFVHLEMLPKGKWPKWYDCLWLFLLWTILPNLISNKLALNYWCRCKTCGGSGLGYCSRCLGTGEYRYIMGFQFMKMENNETQDLKKYENQTNQQQHRRSADSLLNDEELSSEREI